MYTVPTGYKISQAQQIALTFPLRNPAGEHAGSALEVETNSPPARGALQGVRVGPSPVSGVVMEAARAAAVAVSLHQAPCTLHPAPCTLHPTPYTLTLHL